MGDTLNSLLQANRSSSVLQGIANPAQVNPLAAINSANQAAEADYRVRGLQAQQALGNILQQSTDAQGNVDYQDAQRRAAAAGPVVQMGMQSYLTNNAQLRGAQINQAGAMNGLMAQHGMTLMKDPSDANVNAVFDNLGANGVPADVVARERARVLAMSPTDRQNHAYQEELVHLEQMQRVLGETTQQQYGNVARATTITQPTPGQPGSATVSGAPVTIGPPSGSTVTAKMPFDEQGMIPLDEKGVPTRTPTQGWRDVPVPATNIPGVPTGGQQIGGGGGQAPTVPGPGRGTAPSVTPPPGPAGNTTRPAARPPAAQPPPPTTGTGGGGAEPPTQPPAAPTPSVVPSVTKPPVITSAPQQQPEKLESDRKVFAADQAEFPNVMTRAQNLAHAYDALNMLKSNTGKGAAGLQNMRSFLGTLGITTDATMNEQKLVEIVNKYTERAMVDAAGGGATDMARRMAETSNPGTTLGNAANFELMRNDMGKTMQNAAAYQDWAKNKPGDVGGGYPERRAEIAGKTDPRGFVWNMYGPEEQAKINAEVAKNPDAAAKLHRAIGMGNLLNLHPPVSTPPPAGKQSLLMPPAPQQNALTMAG